MLSYQEEPQKLIKHEVMTDGLHSVWIRDKNQTTILDSENFIQVFIVSSFNHDHSLNKSTS